MDTTLLCPTCGTALPVFVSAVTFKPLIPKHRCHRYLRAEYWSRGKRLAVEFSEFPGLTGRQHLVRSFIGQATEDWQPPGGQQGWIAHWVYYG